jgi:uncharacterized protein (TIGR02646 family)
LKVLTRPSCPPALADSADPEHERARAIRHFEDDGRRDGFKFKLYAVKAVRSALGDMTGGRCAYCEAYYDSTAPQDVEHYRPKGRIDTPQGKRKPGYWWLASTWDNLLPSCIRCNRVEEHILHDGSKLTSGKGDRFPIDDEATRAAGRGTEVRETPLLLDPATDNPAAYLDFFEEDGDSIVRPLSADQSSLAYRRARVSIDVYGLNRAGLVLERSRALRRIKQSLSAVELFMELMDEAPPLQRDRYETLFLEEVALIRAHASGQDSFAAVAGPLARATFARLGLRL